MRSFKKIGALCLCAVTVIAFFLVASHLDEWFAVWVKEGHFSALQNEKEQKTVYLNGEAYLPDERVKTVLLIGLDAVGKAGDSGAYYNTDQADFLLVAALNEEEKTCRLLQIDRDTMTAVDLLGVSGAKYGTRVEQIALSHTYGDGTAHSCLNVANGVSKLLYGALIDDYFCVTMDAVSILTDFVGGVPVTMDADYTEIDPSFRKGETVILAGDTAVKWIRARNGTAEPTNAVRMRRQRLYLDAFLRIVFDGEPGTGFDRLGAYAAISDYMVTNCDSFAFTSLANELDGFSFSGTVTPSGTVKTGENGVEFYADEQHLQTLAAEFFFRRAD